MTGRWRGVRFAVVFLMVLMAGHRAHAETLLANGDFRLGGSPPAGWFLDPDVAAKGSVQVIAGGAGPVGVLELAPNARNQASDKPLAIGQLVPASIVRGRTVTVTAQLAADGGAHAVLGMAVLRKDGAGASSQLRDQGSTFVAQSDRLAVPDDDAVVGVVLFIAAEGTAGVARFADIALTAQAAPASATTTAAPSGATLKASVRVDAGHVLRTIPRTLFGTNIEVIRDANGLWDAPNDRLDPQVVQFARDLGVSLVRFPGGVWSDAYDWRDGIGPRAERKPTPTHPGSDETNRNAFGTDEALAFARAIGGSLLITVNAASGTPELAADWVRYVNGEGGRSPRNGRVTWWEIGNELYMEGDMSGGHMSPERYSERVLAFSAAMRAVDPEIKIAAIGLRNFGRYRLNSRDDWNEVVLRRAGKAIDLLAVHDAYAPVVGDAKGLAPADVYAALWAAPQLIARNLRDTRRDIERFAPADAARIRIGVTEWGPLFAVEPASPWVDHVKTLGSAIFVASALKTFAEDPNVELANFFKLNEPSFMGWIGKRGSAWAPTAPYAAFRLVAREMQPDLLAATVDVPTYDSAAAGFIDRAVAVPYLDALATASADGATVTVLLINKSPDAAIAVDLTLTGAAPAAAISQTTLTGSSIDANTGTTLPVIPGLAWARQAAAGATGRFPMGAPDDIRTEQVQRSAVAGGIAVRAPPHSLTLLRLDGVRRS